MLHFYYKNLLKQWMIQSKKIVYASLGMFK